MAFNRPTLAKLVKRARSDLATKLTGSDTNLRGSPEDALAITNAGMTHGAHGHIKWVTRQILADINEAEFLIRQAAIRGMTQTPAQSSTGQATITGTNGTLCPAGTIWVRADGVEYEQDADVTIASGEGTIALTAVEPGTDGDCDVGTPLTISASVVGINATATVSGDGITDGAEIEDPEDLRVRYLEELRTPPSGGGPGDYVRWAKEVAGVTRAWEGPRQLGPGTTAVWFLREDDVDIFPDAGEVAAVQAYLETKAPPTSDVIVIAPTNAPVPFVFASITPDTPAVRAAITAELAALFLAAASPEVETTIPISQIRETISLSAGETDYVLTSPVADIVTPVGSISTLGTVT